jgi:hypothetical protein
MPHKAWPPPHHQTPHFAPDPFNLQDGVELFTGPSKIPTNRLNKIDRDFLPSYRRLHGNLTLNQQCHVLGYNGIINLK